MIKQTFFYDTAYHFRILVIWGAYKKNPKCLRFSRLGVRVKVGRKWQITYSYQCIKISYLDDVYQMPIHRPTFKGIDKDK